MGGTVFSGGLGLAHRVGAYPDKAPRGGVEAEIAHRGGWSRLGR